MVSHRGAKVLIVIAIVFLLAGLGAAAFAFLPTAIQDTAPIPPDTNGTEYFNEYDFAVLAGAHLDGTYSVLNGTPITIFVYNDADYQAYIHGSNLSGVFTTTGTGGPLHIDVPGFGTYHFITQHGPGSHSVEQDVQLSLTETGIDPGYFLGGIIAIVIGVVLLVLGIRRLRTPEPRAVPWAGPMSTPTLPSSARGPDTTRTGEGLYRVPGPLPGQPSPYSASPTGPAAPSGEGAMPMAPGVGGTPVGTIVMTLVNQAPVQETVQIFVNGASAATLTVPPGTQQQLRLTASLSSRFGSMVKVEAVTSAGRRTSQDVFVGGGGEATVAVRIG